MTRSQRNIENAENARSERTIFVSPSARTVRARSHGALQIGLRETGGVAGVDRTVVLEGGKLRVSEGGEVRLERDVPSSIVQRLVERVKALESIQPRRYYGRRSYASDLLTTQLEISDDSDGLEVEVQAISDPRDPAPPQFWEIVYNLRKLSTMDALATATDPDF
jgi:hypothetical protein